MRGTSPSRGIIRARCSAHGRRMNDRQFFIHMYGDLYRLFWTGSIQRMSRLCLRIASEPIEEYSPVFPLALFNAR